MKTCLRAFNRMLTPLLRRSLGPRALLGLLASACASPPPPATPAEAHAPPLSAAPTKMEAEAPAKGSAESDLASRVDPLFAALARPAAPGCAVGVFRAGQIVFSKGYGLANLARSGRRPRRPSTGSSRRAGSAPRR